MNKVILEYFSFNNKYENKLYYSNTIKNPNKNEKNEINEKETIKNNIFKKRKIKWIKYIWCKSRKKKKVKYDNGDIYNRYYKYGLKNGYGIMKY